MPAVRNLAEFLDEPPEMPHPLPPEGEARRDLPEEFRERVHSALEYAMAYQGLDDDECCRRRHRTDEWMEELSWGTRYDDWIDRIEGRAKALIRELTPEEKEAERVRVEEAVKQKKLAEGRAEALLRSALNSKQLKELDRYGHFHVTVEKRRFRITRGRSHNIKEVDARSRILRSLCAHPVDLVPDADTMLGQKLLLETQAEAFFKIANVLRHRRAMPPSAAELRRRAQRGHDRLRQMRQSVANLRRVEELALDATAEIYMGDPIPGVTPDPEQILPPDLPGRAAPRGNEDGNHDRHDEGPEPARLEVPAPAANSRAA